MADEHAPGPSPAYDPWNGQQQPGQGAPQQGQPPQGPPVPQAPQPGAPVRNPDGSWTVEVHPSDGAAPGGAYPQPRRPLSTPSQPTPVQPPQPWMQQPQPQFTPPPQGQPQPGQRRGPRLGLILGISIPVAMLAIGGVVAAFVVPGVLLDRDAQAAADDYAAQVAEWESVYSDAALQPLAELDTASFDTGLATAAPSMGSGSYDEVAADASGVRTACDAMSGLSGQAAMLTASAPALRVVDGGERNDAYAQAAAAAAADGARYEAAAGLADAVAGPFDAIGSACSLVLAQADADAAFTTAYADYLATLTLAQGGTERFDVDASRYIQFTCNAPIGCASFVDRAARANAATAWDAAFVAYNQSMAQSYRDHCPTADLQSTCDAWAGMHDQAVQLASAVSAAYRDEDVTGGAAYGGDTIPAPDATAALEAFISGDETAYASASDATSSATGSSTMLGAIAALVRTEGQTIRDAASAARG
ncbi:hypothetical protein [Agrococcus jejuensis]|uniref:Uncharacterized protein n=1 Tax=Agrococcus jejuensis TaxID=399736 RepID=A0A1G8GDJ5_9MICO|nr:hypothetical protein [Agrococcus jejuensis]SDH92464.1 hypothetical protein SAMN04489720_2879 [Agrococcus jejuensis]